MRYRRRWKVVLLVAVLALGAAACRSAAGSEEEEHSGAVRVEPVDGTELSKVILSQQAADRLGIRTDRVRDARVAGRRGATGPPRTRKVASDRAVLYDANGDTWTFTSPEPLTYLRQRIDVDYVAAGTAVLLAGPPAGTTVVTVGAAELLGAELGVGEE